VDRESLISAAVAKYVASKGGYQFYKDSVDLVKSRVTPDGYVLLASKRRSTIIIKYDIRDLVDDLNPELYEPFLRYRKNKGAVLKVLPFMVLLFVSISIGLSSLYFGLASANHERLAKESVSNQLIDPRSAIFGKFVRSGDRACLTVNSKNRMGGYVGDRLVLLMKIGSGGLVNPWSSLIQDEDESTDFDCQLWLNPSS
jgi:hypothetical protein